MKKLFVLPTIVLALASLLLLAACPDGTDAGSESSVDVSILGAIIREANNEKYGVRAANNASEVPTGIKWVTNIEMDAFDAAINAAMTAWNNRSSQSSVDAAVAALRQAITVFKTAKQTAGTGTAAAVKLSGTITVKNNGQPVPFVEIAAHNEAWSWSASTRIASLEAYTAWEIITEPFTETTTIYFEIHGFADDKYDYALFGMDVKDLTRNVYNTDVNDIVMDLANLRFITLSGTISGTYDGNLIPTVRINATDGGILFGGTTVHNVGNNISWSMLVEAFDTDTDIFFNIWGFTGPNAWSGEELFFLWAQNYSVRVKNTNKSGINIRLDNIKPPNPPITLSGTINVTYDGEPVPCVRIVALTFSRIDDDDGSEWYDWIGDTTLQQPGNNAPWSITIEGFDNDTEVFIQVLGSNEAEFDYDNLLFDCWADTVTVKNQNRSGIVLDLGNQEPWSWDEDW
jgi:hypothetical protein